MELSVVKILKIFLTIYKFFFFTLDPRLVTTGIRSLEHEQYHKYWRYTQFGNSQARKPRRETQEIF